MGWKTRLNNETWRHKHRHKNAVRTVGADTVTVNNAALPSLDRAGQLTNKTLLFTLITDGISLLGGDLL